MDGGRGAMDNVFIERRWRSVNYEEVYINNYETVRDAKEDIGRCMNFAIAGLRNAGCGVF